MRGFIALAWLFAAVINGAMWYRPAPVVAAPVKVASWLKMDKVQDRLPVHRVPTTAYRLDVAAITATPERSLPWSCETIRNAVAGLSEDQIDRMARIYRLTKQQRVEAKKCLRKDNT